MSNIFIFHGTEGYPEENWFPWVFHDNAFSGFDFNWGQIKKKAQDFVVFQSDDDPYVGLENGKELAKNLGVEISFVPNAGHFNKKAGYIKFEQLREKVLQILGNNFSN